MSLLANSNAIAAASGGLTGNERSLRLRASASAYGSWTPAGAGNQQVMTISLWIKRGSLGTLQIPFACNDEYIRFHDTPADSLRIKIAGSNLIATQLFRDPNAFFHLCVAVDTTQATASNRIKVYINDTQVTSFSTETYPTQNANAQFNSTNQHALGCYVPTPQLFFDGYLAEFYFIGGSQLTPSSFGELNTNNIWVPKTFTGSYSGTNSRYYNFRDTTSTTTLGYDSSGNNNHMTLTNVSLTAGTTYDSMLDYPVNGTAGTQPIGNYATLNPLNAYSGSTFQDANLGWYTNTSYYGTYATLPCHVPTYFEVSCAAITGGALVGFVKNASINPNTGNFFTGTGFYGALYSNTLNYYINGTSDGIDHGNITDNLMHFSVDPVTGKCWVGSGGTWFGSGDPAAGTNPAWTISVSSGDVLFPAFCAGNSTQKLSANFGQRPFAYTPPSGFKALCTTNMTQPASAVAKSSDHFQVVLDTGANIRSTAEALFTYELEWIKDRANANDHQLANSVTGGSSWLESNTTDAERTYSAPSGNSVAWVWKLPSAGVSNTNGSITSTVSANTDAGISVVTCTTTTAVNTVGHGLGRVPAMIIGVNRNPNNGWCCYHKDLGPTKLIFLNTTAAASSNTAVWNDTAPTSSVFTYGAGGWNNNGTAVFYCFAEIEGFSKFGSYTGNGSTNGPFVWCGFRPAFVLVKRSSSTGVWNIIDSKRSGYNVDNDVLLANAADAEYDGGAGTYFDIVSNGFVPRDTNVDRNGNGSIYSYAAFAEYPFALNCRAR